MDFNVAAVTVRSVEPEIVPRVAEIFDEPTLTEVASPALLIVATPVVAEAQVTELVILSVLPSEYVPVAVNGCVVPNAIDGFGGVTAIEVSVRVLTVRIVVPLCPLIAAEIVVVPPARPVANPGGNALPPPVVIVAMRGLDELQFAVVVMFFTVPSL